MALRDVMDHVVETSRAPTPARTSRIRPIFTIVLCAALLGASAYSWIARPERIWGPSGRAPTPVIDRANARVTLAIVAQRLEAARARAGHYPLSLAEVGEGGSGIGYELLGDTGFVITARSAGDTIVFRSHQDPSEFLGKSVELISGSRR